MIGLIKFVIEVVIGLFVGIAFGFFGVWVTKQFDKYNTRPSIETISIFTVGLLSYYTMEANGKSGAISIVTTAFFISHYGWYNLSTRG